MKPQAVAFLGVMLLGVTVGAQETVDLDVTRVALFSSGVGYFECTAEVSGTKTAELRFRTDQINDILKSLVVQDFGGGTIGAVSYAARDPVEKALRSFAVDITGKPTLGELLDQLRGEVVEIGGPRALRGAIVGVETQLTVVGDHHVVERDVLNLLTESGLEQMALAELRGIRLLDEKVDGELRKALATLAEAHDADKKSVVLRFDGAGRRKVRAAYLLEAPIWKTSYRLVLSGDEPPFMQGWATVENATEKDWRDVRLSLVSGRPISFRMDLYTPLYVPRPLEELELYASLRAPQYEGGMELRGAQRSAGRGRQMARGRAQMMEMAAADAYAGEAPAPLMSEAPEELDLSGRGVASVAAAQQAGELFEYVIQAPVSIPRQHSAMLPIVNAAIAGEKVSIYNPSTHEKYPLNGLELVNATDLHLMQGPVTVFDGSVYAGDAKLPDMKPGEKRLIAYALDLATEVAVERMPRPEELMSLRIAKGVLWYGHKYLDERKYVIKNKAERERAVILEQPYTPDWTLVEPREPYERTPRLLRLRVDVPAGQSVSYRVKLERQAEQSLRLLDCRLDTIDFYLRSRVISPAVREALERLVALRTELTDVSRQCEKLEQELNEVVADQVRLRDNLRTLPQGTDVYARQLRKFDELETRIGQLRAQIETARQAREQKRTALEEYLLALEVS
jgi:hypothetical protein